MNTKELKIFKKQCLDTIANAKSKRRSVVKSICPNCYNTIESIVAPQGTWNNKHYDLITKGCYECASPHFLKMNENITESFGFESPHIKHIYRQ